MWRDGNKEERISKQDKKYPFIYLTSKIHFITSEVKKKQRSFEAGF